jgi:hypothetical protein
LPKFPRISSAKGQSQNDWNSTVLRLIGFLFMLAITAGGYMYFDFKMASRWASETDADGLTVTEYLGGLSGRLAGLAGSGSTSGLPTKLADMLPKPPEGWTVRPTLAEDVDGFLPKSEKNAEPSAIEYIRAMAVADQGNGVEAVAMTYEKGDRKVVIKAMRYPNVIFTSPTAMDQREELQMTAAAFRGTEFMTVRGLDVSEDLLPEGFRGRYFLADAGAQIHLRILAPKRTKDKELLPFFETLHVKAMNASVIDKEEGLGEVPVIVLASALDEASRAAYVAGVAERAADRAGQREKERAAAEAKVAEVAAQTTGGGLFDGLFGGGTEAAPEEAPKPAAAKAECSTDANGTKRCTVEGAAEE